jgi:pathogenesis-related protein 1
MKTKTMSIVAVAVLALVVSAGSAGKKKKEAPVAAVPPLSSLCPDARAYIDAHNAVRAAVQKPKDYPQEWAPIGHLEWSDEIAATSQQWAEHLRDANKCGLVHSDTRYGENLAGGQGMDAAQAVKLWASEIGNFVYTPIYDFQRNRGHYSQLIWRKTTHVGCGRASCGRKAVVVCRYDPPGNHIGRPPY